MHNKAWIADNRIALTGGRNIGDEYFAASEATNFFDLDFLVFGPAVAELSRNFDEYWNSPASYPVSALSPELVNAASLETLRKRAARNAGARRRLALRARAGRLRPARADRHRRADIAVVAHWQVLADAPLKSLQPGSEPPRSRVLEALREAMRRHAAKSRWSRPISCRARTAAPTWSHRNPPASRSRS
jgi:putative cardiolipin synthase